jgi:hypothetical protein
MTIRDINEKVEGPSEGRYAKQSRGRMDIDTRKAITEGREKTLSSWWKYHSLMIMMTQVLPGPMICLGTNTCHQRRADLTLSTA